jgi:hypothetical protein
MFRIEADRARFREIVRGRIRADLRKYLSTGELIGRAGEHAVSIPLPQIELPRFQFGENPRGKGGKNEGEGERGEGEAAESEGGGAAGNQPGAHILEVEVELDELAEMLGQELELPNIEPRGVKELAGEGGRYNGVRAAGPDSLRQFRRSFKNALKRTLASGAYDPVHPRIVPIRADFRFRMRKACPAPESSAVVFHMMDVSGSMGREQKEIVRIKAFWIDTWLRSQYKNLEVVYVVHDAVARIVDQHTFVHLRESGGTKISSAYALAADLVGQHFPASEWNIYLFHFSDGDNWSGRDTEKCLSLLKERLLPDANLFCYGQVKSAYGSGQFKKDLDQALATDTRVISAEILDREGILPAIKAFLGKGL